MDEPRKLKALSHAQAIDLYLWMAAQDDAWLASRNSVQIAGTATRELGFDVSGTSVRSIAVDRGIEISTARGPSKSSADDARRIEELELRCDGLNARLAKIERRFGATTSGADSKAASRFRRQRRPLEGGDA